ncbi:MAG: Ppx/GppA family phosphatase [Bacteroidetes bacterium]|nr:Ppx/GppA family phosphatase [Bacteroidota bacterium]MCH8523267.1 Ppx/GppA family phosphatase [Balneolales bacterium]
MQLPDFNNFPKYSAIWSQSGIKAAIDIGTNTVLLLIADVQNGKVYPIHEEQRLPRLGRGLHKRGYLTSDGIESVIMVLQEYRSIISNYGEIPVIVTATSAVRDATNKMEFLWMVEEGTGYRVRLLSGNEEAICAYSGAVSQVAEKNSVCIDIGGGSTEFSFLSDKEIVGCSYNIGTVRLLDIVHDSSDRLSAGKEYIQMVFDGKPESGNRLDWAGFARRPLLGVAGTATTLAALYLNMKSYKPEAINGLSIPVKYVEDLMDKLSRMTPDEILSLNPVFLKGREDLMFMGCLILDEALKRFGADYFLVSTGGIRHGALLTPLYS